MDEESGLQYFKARYYDPELGRFLSPDAFEGHGNLAASWHSYQYAYNNPLKWVDPSGNQSIDWSSMRGAADKAILYEQELKSANNAHLSQEEVIEKLDKAGDHRGYANDDTLYNFGINATNYLNQHNRGAHADSLGGAILNTLNYGTEPFLGSSLNQAALSESVSGWIAKGYNWFNGVKTAPSAINAVNYSRSINIANEVPKLPVLVGEGKGIENVAVKTSTTNSLGAIKPVVQSNQLKLFNDYNEPTILLTKGMNEQIEFLGKYIPEMPTEQARSILEAVHKADGSVVLGGSRVRGNFNTTSDIDIGYSGLSKSKAYKINKNQIKLADTNKNWIKVENTLIVKGNQTQNIGEIESAQQFFQNRGIRAGSDPNSGKPFYPSGYIEFKPNGTIIIEPPIK